MKKILIGIIIFLILIFILIGASYVTYDSVVNIDTIYKGISINGVDVSNLSKEAALEKVIREDENINSSLNLFYKDYNFTYSYESLGYRPNYEEAVKAAYNYGREGSPRERFLTVTDLNTTPINFQISQGFNLDNVNEVIEHLNNVISYPPVDATFALVNDEVVITDEAPGYHVDNDKTRELIMASIYKNEPIEIPVGERQAEITREYFSALKGEIGSFTTNYSSSIQNRKENIKLAAKLIDGTILMPGQQVSFNEEIGEISASTGFLPATVINEGNYESGTGGGICQVSTTLYNAAVKADLQIDERRNHSRPVNYVPLGLDAAVASGLLDLKITNPFDFPIYIKAEADNNNITFKIIGDTDKKDYDVDFISQKIETIGSTTKKEFSSALPKGQTEVTQSGSTGYKYASYKIKKKDGQEISRENYLSSHYPARNTIITVGTKEAPVSTSEESTGNE